MLRNFPGGLKFFGGDRGLNFFQQGLRIFHRGFGIFSKKGRDLVRVFEVVSVMVMLFSGMRRGHGRHFSWMLTFLRRV